jgi:hypothetical protein
MFAKGWGNAWVGVYGNVNIRCNGMPSLSAHWTTEKVSIMERMKGEYFRR